jgi:hypothetical protein
MLDTTLFPYWIKLISDLRNDGVDSLDYARTELNVRMLNKLWIGKFVVGKCRDLNSGAIPEFVSRDWEKLWEYLVKISGLETEIWMQDLPSTKHYYNPFEIYVHSHNEPSHICRIWGSVKSTVFWNVTPYSPVETEVEHELPVGLFLSNLVQDFQKS